MSGVNAQRDKHTERTLNAERQRRLEDLQGWTWDPQAAQWEQGFSRLRDYVKRHGHARVPRSYTVDGYKLGSWVNNQRAFHSRDILDAERQRRLQELPGWTWDPKADQWEEGFRRLLEYVKLNGHARVVNSYMADDYRLGQWVAVQRRFHAKGILDAERQRRLEDLPGWTWAADTAKWEEGFSRLQDYVERHGDARVPADYMLRGYPVGNWTHIQRHLRSKGTLDAERQRRLEELPGWTWDALADRWEEGFSRLQQYVKRHGHARVPKSYTVDGYPLGAWMGTQRVKHGKGTLNADYQCRLEDLPGWTWDSRAAKWEEAFSRLQQYVKRHGHARVPKSYTDNGYKLGEWIATQRSFHSRGTLDADRENRLQDLPGWTWKASSSP